MLDTHFKMNERVFNYELGALAEGNQDSKYAKELYFDHTTKTGGSRINNAARATDQGPAKHPGNNFVI